MVSNIVFNTNYFFGKGTVKTNLPNILKTLKTKSIMIMYGGGSIKQNGAYFDIIKAIKKNKTIKIVEHCGIQPNPLDTDAYTAALLGKKNKIDLIIAVGGGSVIDEAKVTAGLITNPQFKNAWDYVKQTKLKLNYKPIPLVSIITLAATGSENNNGSVITNSKTRDKWAVFNACAPQYCLEDPTYTLTVSKWQTSCGIFDIFSHLLELYYDLGPAFFWNKQYILMNLKVLIKNAYIVLNKTKDYDARANILWTSSWSLNPLTSALSENGGDWTVHALEHVMSGLWDISHGAGLALITPTYIKQMCLKSTKFKKLSLEIANELFKVNTIPLFLTKIEKFISDLKLPKKYTDFSEIKKISVKEIEWLVKSYKKRNGTNGKFAREIFTKIKK